MLCISGCQSAWEKFYQPTGTGRACVVTPAESVQLREVEGDRYRAYLADQKNRFQASNRAVEDWSPSDVMAETNLMLATLRIPHTAPKALIIGVSSFGFLGAVNVKEYEVQELEKLAKKKGADYVVVTKMYKGIRRGIAYAPETTFSQSSGSATAVGTQGYATGNYQGTGTSTTYVPYQYENEDWDIYGFFVRVMRPTDQLPYGFK